MTKKTPTQRLIWHPNPWIYRPVLIISLCWAIPATWTLWVGEILSGIGRYIKEGFLEGLDLIGECWEHTKDYSHLTWIAIRVGWALPSERDALIEKLSKEDQ